MNRFRRGWTALALLFPGLLVAGLWYIARSGPGQVLGTVRLNGEVLKSDRDVTVTVHLVANDGTQFTGLVGSDGRYVVKDVPFGPVKIAVTGDPAMPPGLYAPGKKPLPNPALDRCLRHLERYKDPQRSGLTITVASGKQPHDIELND